MRPTIYIPSRLTKLLIPFAGSRGTVLPVRVGLLGPGDSRRPGGEDRGNRARGGPCAAPATLRLTRNCRDMVRSPRRAHSE